MTRRLADSVARLCAVTSVLHAAGWHRIDWKTAKAIDTRHLERNLGAGGPGRGAQAGDGRVCDPAGPSLDRRGGGRGAQAWAVGGSGPLPGRGRAVLRT
ncbi:transposase family protein [Xanthomonas theicola]|nr:transposase family protein [Xanthomonas theicola]